MPLVIRSTSVGTSRENLRWFVVNDTAQTSWSNKYFTSTQTTRMDEFQTGEDVSYHLIKQRKHLHLRWLKVID